MFSVKHPRKYARNNIRHQKPIKSRKGKPFFKAINASWKDFCTTSSFVGFRYFYFKNRTIIDVLFWVLLMAVLMYWSITFVSDFLDRYHSMSTTTIIQTQHHPTTRSMFPAVTACLTARVSKSKVHNFIDNIMSNTELHKNVNITKFVEIFNLNTNLDSTALSNAGRVFEEYNLTMRDMLNMTSHSCEEMSTQPKWNGHGMSRRQIFTVCRWAGQLIPCTMVFRKTMAVGGFCCSFNYPLPPEKIRRKKWLRTNTFGLKGGLSFAFKRIGGEDYYYKVDYGNTLRVLVHPPHTVPTFRENDILIAKSTENAIEITNIYNTADSKVKRLPIEDRDCAFGNERELKNFVRYTNKNCLVQCRMDRVINNCGCISYYYPSDGNHDICPTEKFPCSFENRQVAIGTMSIPGSQKIFTEFSDCDCPDDCHVVKQYTKVNSWKLSTYNNYSIDEFYSKVTKENGVVHISFTKSFTMRLNRKLSFDEIELASNIGGIIALFLGCSFVSVIEAIYFLIIRILTLYHAKI